jgi:hypothetical protein
MLEIVARWPGPAFSAGTSAAAVTRVAAGAAAAVTGSAAAPGSALLAPGLGLVARARFVRLGRARRRTGPARRLALARFMSAFGRMALSYLGNGLGSCSTGSFSGRRGLATQLIN